jgi:hypothetical protein
LTKFGGWLIFRKWVYNLARDKFSIRLVEAKEALTKASLPRYTTKKLKSSY